jgi:acetyltransferase-like isoleucine patch superfamily enzyme
MRKQMPTRQPAAKASGFVRANGVILFVQELFRRAMLIARRSFFASRLNAPGLALGPRCRLRGLAYMQIGRDFRVMEGLWLEALDRYKEQEFAPRIIIGENVSISRWSHISAIDHVELGSRTLIGNNVFISDHNHGTYAGLDQTSPQIPPALRPLGGGGPVMIGEDVWIGNNAVILGPVTIGDGAIIAANSIVTRDVLSNTMVAGVPAKPMKRFSESSGVWEKL